MIAALILFLVPTLLFVVGFLYETFLSFLRLKNPKAGKSGYLNATWEVTHTLLVFGVVMLIMMFTKSLDDLAAQIFTTTFWAALVLAIRAVLYTYIFYVRKKPNTSWIDWTFAFSHIAAALLLVATVVKALIYLIGERPEANTQFIPYFIPGLVVVLAVCFMPLVTLYTTKK